MDLAAGVYSKRRSQSTPNHLPLNELLFRGAAKRAPADEHRSLIASQPGSQHLGCTERCSRSNFNGIMPDDFGRISIEGLARHCLPAERGILPLEGTARRTYCFRHRATGGVTKIQNEL